MSVHRRHFCETPFLWDSLHQPKKLGTPAAPNRHVSAETSSRAGGHKRTAKKAENPERNVYQQGQETTRELEQLRKCSNDVTLSNAKIATQVRDNTRQKKKKDLHEDYEELQIAHLIKEEKYQADLQAEKHKNKLLLDELDRSVSQLWNRCHESQTAAWHSSAWSCKGNAAEDKCWKTECTSANSTCTQDNFTAGLQVEAQRNKLLHEELDKISASQQDISQRYEIDDHTVRQQAETLQHQLQKEVQQRTPLHQKHKELIKIKTSSHETFTAELQEEKQKNNLLPDKLDGISHGD